jgi:hypothetical protein
MDEGRLCEWFAHGMDMGARYMMIVFDIRMAEMRPVYVFPEQNIQQEVVDRAEDPEIDLKIVMDLNQDRDVQIVAAIRPEVVVSSRRVN